MSLRSEIDIDIILLGNLDTVAMVIAIAWRDVLMQQTGVGRLMMHMGFLPNDKLE